MPVSNVQINHKTLLLCTGASLKKLEMEKGIILRFVIGRRLNFISSKFHEHKIRIYDLFMTLMAYSSNKGDGANRAIDEENRLTNDFLILVSYFLGVNFKINQLVY